MNEAYSYLKQQPDATWLSTPVGPFDTLLRVNGPADPKVTVPAYQNIEADPAWMITQRHRKIILTSSTYQPGFGAVNFRIQGYDGSGEKVPGATDTVKLLIDQNFSTGDVDSVRLVGGSDPGECALLELSSPGDPLVIRYRVRENEGFLQSFGLAVFRGSNTSVPIGGSPSPGRTPMSHPSATREPRTRRGQISTATSTSPSPRPAATGWAGTSSARSTSSCRRLIVSPTGRASPAAEPCGASWSGSR